MPARSLKAGRLWFFYLLLTLLLLGFQEALFRFVFPVPEIANFNRINYSMMVNAQGGEDSPEEKVRPLSNEAYIWASDPDGVEFVHRLNLYGFRDHDWPVSASQRVMFVGDSFVEGFMATDDQTIPRGFESASIAADSQLKTVNLGIGASGFADYLAVIRDAVPIFHPDLVVLVLYANDFPVPQSLGGILESGQAVLKSNRYLPRLYGVVSSLSRGERVATRWLKPPFMYLPNAESVRSPLHDPALLEYAKGFVSPEILLSMQQGRFNPFVINEQQKYERHLRRPANFYGIIGQVKSYVEAYGGQLLVIYIPYKGQVSDAYLAFTSQFDSSPEPLSLTAPTYQVHASLLREECQRAGVPLLDMTSVLRQREAGGERVYWNYDEHMKGQSYLLIGEEIFAFWQQL